MKKILHLFRNSQFTEGYIKAVNKYCKRDNHFFLVYGNSFKMELYDYLYEKNVRYVLSIAYELQKPKIVDYISSFDSIIYHGVFVEEKVVEFFYKNDYLLNKLYLYFWGGDIPLGEQCLNMKKKVVHDAAGIVVIVESDYKKILNLYQPTGPYWVIKYVDERRYRFMKCCLTPSMKKVGDEVYVQIGNSATRTNRHIEILKKIEKYKNENIKLFVPLAYGDKAYAEEIQHYLEEHWKNKYIVLNDMVSVEEYIKMLKRINVGIFAMDRQQALGNTNMLLANGCKIFVKKDGQIDQYFSGELDCHISYVEQIDAMGFTDFCEISTENQIHNSKKIFQENDFKDRIEKWNAFFERIGEDK